MTLEKCIIYATKQNQRGFYSGLCSGKFCNKDIFTVFNTLRYCAPGCNTTTGKREFTCTNCNKQFLRRTPRGIRSKRPFCTIHCYFIFNNGLNHSGYKGKEFLDKKGYRVVSISGRRIKEHRWVMEQCIGRPLTPNEVVHHINHNKSDNRLENLKIMLPGEHTAMHAALRRERKPLMIPSPA